MRYLTTLLLLLTMACGSLPQVCDRYEAEQQRILTALATAESLLPFCNGSDCHRLRALISGLRATLEELAALCDEVEDRSALTALHLALIREKIERFEQELEQLKRSTLPDG